MKIGGLMACKYLQSICLKIKIAQENTRYTEEKREYCNLKNIS